jgi:allantoate deiminase/N-carbamoyl-L-amino-acid hydrolase
MSSAEQARATAPARVRERLEILARIGAERGGGVSRLAYTADERAAHETMRAWAAEDGAESGIDQAGNTVAVYAPGEPYFLLGSHLDSVVHGGGFDGTVGVLAALEAAAALVGEIAAGVRVVAFAGEEGARFGRPNLGSALAAGAMSPEQFAALHDADGVTLSDAAGSLGLDPLAVEPWLTTDRIACFFEVHIEQGRTLEASAARIGLVDAIAGSVRLRLEIRGRADHSGATPMRMRADALAAASEIVLAAERVGRDYRSTVVTVGRQEIEPNSVTTVPGWAALWVDIRDVDADIQRATAAEVVERAREICERRALPVQVELISDQAPVVLPAWPRALAREESECMKVPYRVLSSGAGHDAAVVAHHAASAMVFVPCVEGVSHSPRENASPADVALAAHVVVATIRRADPIVC